jgi:hypothetical protein
MTYSLSITGDVVGPFAATEVTLSDANAQTGSQANACQLGTSFLCKNPDGSQTLYTIDAERSIPGQEIVLKPVFP